MEIISRKEAKAKGLKFYYSGKQCKNGHMVERYVVNGNCTLCTKKDSKIHRQNNPEYHKEYKRRTRLEHPEKRKQYRDNNKDRIKLYNKTFTENHPEYSKQYRTNNKENISRIKKQWRTENMGKVNETNSSRRARKIQASPVWANKKTMVETYQDCKAAGCTEVFHVDHIVPLISETVCGLHVEDNLQIITATENLSKGNTWNG